MESQNENVEQNRRIVSNIGMIFICLVSLATIAVIVCGYAFDLLAFAREWDSRIIVSAFGYVMLLGGIIMLISFFISLKFYSGKQSNTESDGFAALNMMGDAMAASHNNGNIYLWVRYPVYSAFFLINTGALMAYGNFVFMVLPVFYWVIFTIVIHENEEPLLIARFGTEYEKYRGMVSGIIPTFPPSRKPALNEYRKSIRMAVAGILVSVVLISLFSRAISTISAKMTYESILEVKKTMLKETVDSTIAYIDEYVDRLVADETNAFAEGSKPGIRTEDLEKLAEETIRMKIYAEKYEDGTYMWVNKVLNYDGGDGYGIRLIHSNLKDTEGALLSTNTINEMGMKAYEIELEGVKKSGSIYQNYAFKKINSDEVTEKITYSALYKRFDWIVCMGVNIDNLPTYTRDARAHFALYQHLVLAIAITTWISFLLLAVYIYRKTHIGLYENTNKELSRKLNIDALTGVGSRLFGEMELASAYEDYKNGKKDTLLLIADVDYFKQFNDNHGHDVGDKVLRAFAEAIKKSTRSNDSVIRWGGDEFIVILRDIPKRYQAEAANRILDNIRAIEIEELDGKKIITASMGFAYFNDSDPDAKSTLSRADAALYRAKEAGRDTWRI